MQAARYAHTQIVTLLQFLHYVSLDRLVSQSPEASMFFSHELPLKQSRFISSTVPGSRQCGIIPKTSNITINNN